MEAEHHGADVRLDLVSGKYASLVYLANGHSTLWSVEIKSRVELKNVRLCISYTPEYARPQQFRISHTAAGQSIALRVPCPEYDEAALLGVTEDEPGSVCVKLLQEDGALLAQAEDEFRWLPYNAWAGGTEFPELLAALTLPYDPALDTVLQDLSTRSRHVGEWPGYNDEPQAVLDVIHKLWDVLLKYSPDSKTSPIDDTRDISVGQQIHTPSMIRKLGYSTSLDSTLLFAACLARVRLNPIILLTRGHSFIGVFLKKASLPSPQGTPAANVRNLLHQGDLLTLETTFLTRHASFESAAEAAAAQLIALSPEDEFTALDVEQIWHELGIHPIMGPCPQVNSTGSQKSDSPDTLISTKPTSRMESWQRKLLDLSLRNNLLNTRQNSRLQISLTVPHVAELEDELAANASFRIKTLPDTHWSDSAASPTDDASDLISRRTHEAAVAMYRKRELLAGDLKPAALQNALHALYLASRREMEESGVNSLYIACGFLRWAPKGAPEGSTLQAPLLLIPVQLKRTSVRDGFTLSGMEDETYINHTLLELLKTEFSIRIPQLEGELPKDDSGLDVPLIFDIVRKAICHIAGWEVIERCVLGTFSFSKYLMWRDMMDRREMLLRNPVVAHLAATDRGTFPEQVGFPELSRLDHEADAHKIYTPLASDSSQLAAVLAAARGKNFVLEGPPGTGKSQTIANMIAHCLGHGKTVLFVAEKAVALEVVHKRLARIGLGDYCLELHSNKAILSAVMNQFRAAVSRLSDRPADDEWDESVDSMTAIRHRLNLLPEEMHREYPDGTSLYSDICSVADHPETPTLPLPTSLDPLSCTRSQKRVYLELAEELAAHYELISADARPLARYMRATEYSPEWEKQLDAELTRCADTLDRFLDMERQIAETLGLSASEIQANQALFSLALEIAEAHADADWGPLLPSCAAKTLRALDTALQHARQYRRHRESLSIPYPDSILREADLDVWLRDCKLALAKIWPMSWWSMRKLRRILQVQAMSSRTPDCPRDLQALVAMRDEARATEQALINVPKFLHRGVETQDTHEAQQLADALESACCEDEDFAYRLLELRHRFADDRRLAQKLSSLHVLRDSVLKSAEQLSALLGAPTPYEREWSQACAWLRGMLAAKPNWRHITLWNKCVQTARESECGDWAEALLTGHVLPGALTDAVRASLAFAKLQAAGASVETLRDFAALIHEKRIRDFAEQERTLRERTSAHIRSILAARAAGTAQHGRETALLQHELSKKRMFMPLRKLLAATPNVTPLLKPCFLMSPLSVAQYLGPETKPFDVVIFDEASQIPVWDAIGAIGRGSSVIICGDPHQMPPTSFFSRSRSDEETDDDATEADLESILDECLACGIPKMNLTWHYRSKSESLISFSNEHYYEGKMTTFPSPAIRDTALQLHRIAGIYEPGATKRINQSEAQAVVQHVLQTLRQPDFRYTEATSIGIVTFNAQQQKLITDLFEDERAKDPSLEPFFSEDNPEAVFVKNLENVQGDERGVIYFSTTYGRDREGRMAMNFGPLNLTGGERRLNVAVTRARYAMHVFTSMQPEDIDLTRTRARGAADLRAFLEYARNSAQLSAAGISTKNRDALAQHIAQQLEKLGWRCRTQIGASDYQVDLVVEHPTVENAVLAGITLDGPTYAAAHTARDRDVVRPDTMRLLGWQMLPIWSIDWWHNPEACIASLISKLERLKAAPPAAQAELPSLISTGEAAAPESIVPPTENQTAQPPHRLTMTPGPDIIPYEQKEPLPALFEISDKTLKSLINNIIEQEAPMSMELLIARLFQIAPVSFSRQSRIYAECLSVLEKKLRAFLKEMQAEGRLHLHTETTADSSAKVSILSIPGQPKTLPRACGYRPLEGIPLSELREIARLVQAELHCMPGSDDHIRGMSDFLRLPRLTRKAKEYLLTIVQTQRD